MAYILPNVTVFTGIYELTRVNFLCEGNILKNGVNGLTMDHETPSCRGCILRCGFRKERVVSVEALAVLTKQDLVVVVTKVYGFPLAVLVAVLLFESVLFSTDSIVLLFVLLSILPISIFLMTRWAKEDISEKRRKMV